jgi:hypothetical protein
MFGPTIYYIITTGVGGSFTIPVDEKTFNTVKNDLGTFPVTWQKTILYVVKN